MNFVSIGPLMTNIFSAVFCLGCSAAFHLLSVHSQLTHNILARLDYGGISVLIFGTSQAFIYYSFACSNVAFERWFWIFVILTLCTICFIVSLLPSFD